DRHPLEEGDVLERPGDALFRGLVRDHPAPPHAAERHAAPARVIDAVDDVQERALAGAVGADDRADLALPDLERHVREGRDAAEGERDVLDAEQDVSGRARQRAHQPEILRTRPPRAAIFSSIRSKPRSRWYTRCITEGPLAARAAMTSAAD